MKTDEIKPGRIYRNSARFTFKVMKIEGGVVRYRSCRNECHSADKLPLAKFARMVIEEVPDPARTSLALARGPGIGLKSKPGEPPRRDTGRLSCEAGY